MSRHRNVRSMNYKDEYDGYDDVYGHSVEDDSCISPSDAAQWIYDRNNRSGVQHGIGSYLDADKDIPEENEEEDEVEFGRRDSVDLPQLSSVEKAKLASCLEEIKNVIGETIPERSIVEIIIKHDFDLAKSLDEALNSNNSSKEDFSKKGTTDKDLSTSSKNKKPMSLKDLMQSANKSAKVFKPLNLNLNKTPNSVNNDVKTEFNSLDELTSFHLKNAGTNNFMIPKFNLNKPQNDLKFVVPKLNLSSTPKKQNDTSSKSETTALETWHIDLTSALKNIPTPIQKTKTNNNTKHDSSDENFTPQFVDCEVEVKEIEVAECCLNISSILDVDLKHLTKKRSSFGKILCRNYVSCYKPEVPHKFEVLNKIEPFKFDVPSPDDNVQKFVKK